MKKGGGRRRGHTIFGIHSGGAASESPYHYVLVPDLAPFPSSANDSVGIPLLYSPSSIQLPPFSNEVPGMLVEGPVDPIVVRLGDDRGV